MYVLLDLAATIDVWRLILPDAETCRSAASVLFSLSDELASPLCLPLSAEQVSL